MRAGLALPHSLIAMSGAPDRLPITEIRADLVAALDRERCRIVIEAPTGSGKSTQVPQYLLDALDETSGEIWVLQPRKLATRALAKRVAYELGEPLGQRIGYQIRDEFVGGKNTRVRFVTEGILLRRLAEDATLRGIIAIVFDEFHERNVFSDLSLARAAQVQETRPDLKLVLMSATLDSASLLDWLGEDAVGLRSDGRCYPVEEVFLPSRTAGKKGASEKIWDHLAAASSQYFQKTPNALAEQQNVLIFLPGRFEIRKTHEALKRCKWTKDLEIHELFSELSPEKQDKALASGSARKIILSTNVAETSLTIDGVTLVIDSGLERRSSFDHRRQTQTLLIEPISQASAAQRAGRAGRVRPGTVLRMWSENSHHQRLPRVPAEIHRTDLSSCLLWLLASGVESLEEFPWFEAPEAEAFDKALQLLRELGAIDGSSRLTEIGRLMGRLPIAPRYARLAIEGAAQNSGSFFCLIAAMAESRDLFPHRRFQQSHLMPEDFAEPDDCTDWLALIRAWSQLKQLNFPYERCRDWGIHHQACREVDQLATRLCRTLRCPLPTAQTLFPAPPEEIVATTFLAAFADQLACKKSASTLACHVSGGRSGSVEKGCVGAGKEVGLFITNEMIEVAGATVTTRLSKTTRVDPAVLKSTYPDDFQDVREAVYDEKERRVIGLIQKRFRDLVLDSRIDGQVPTDLAAELLAQQVLAGNLKLKRWDQKVDEFIGRVNCLHRHQPDYGIEAIDEDTRLLLVTEICQGATRYKEIKDRDPWPTLKSWVPSSMRSYFDAAVPERYSFANGRSGRISYADPDQPVVSVLIQHIFGLSKQPHILDGKCPLGVEILAPNHRPIQMTDDLPAFWTGSYSAVRSQLRGRYPKHDWPEF